MTLLEKIKWFSACLCSIVLTIALLMLIGEAAFSDLFVNSATTALVMVFLSISYLLLITFKEHISLRQVGRMLAYMVLSVGSFKTLLFFFHPSSMVTKILSTIWVTGDTDGAKFQMDPITALCFVLLGWAVLLFSAKPVRNNISKRMAMITALITWLTLVSYVFAGNALFFHMPLPAAISFFLLSIILLLSDPVRDTSNTLSGLYPMTKMTRIFMPAVLITPLVMGYIRLADQGLHVNTSGLTSLFLIVGISAIISGVVWLIARYMEKADRIRSLEDAEHKALNEKLYSYNEEMMNEELRAANEELSSTNDQLVMLNDQLVEANRVIEEQARIIVKQKDEQLNRVLDTSNDVIWSFDLTAGQDHYISRSAAKIFECGLEILMTNRYFWYNAVVEEDQARIARAKMDLDNRGTAECIYRISIQPGHLHWMHCRVRRIKDSQGNAIREEGIVSDITEKKIADEALQLYQQNLDIIFSTTQEGILLVDENEKVVLFNDSYRQFIAGLAGFEPVVGINFFDIVVPERRAIARSLFQRALTGELTKTEGYFHSPQGTIIHSLSYQPVYSHGHISHVCIVSTDITRAKEKELLLQQSEANLRAIFDNTDDAFILLDGNKNIVSYNRSGKEAALILYKHTINKGDNLLDYIPEERQELVRGYFARSRNGDKVRHDFQTTHQGEDVWYNYTLIKVSTNEHDFVGYCLTIRNYTEQRKAEKALRDNEERFRSLVENSGDIIGLVNNAGNVIYMNAGVVNILGFTSDELSAHAWGILIHADDRELYELHFKEVINNPGRLYRMEFRVKHKQGGWRWMEGSAVNQLDTSGINGIVVNFKDITDRRTIEEERKKLMHQLADKNNDLLQFSFITSHNLRGPIASLLGVLNLLDRETLTADAKQLVMMFDLSVKKLDAVLKDMSKILTIRTQEEHVRERVDIADTLHAVTTLLQSQIEDYKAQIIIHDGGVHTFYTVKSYFYSILYNLISNAIKFRAPDRHPHIEIFTFKTETHVGFTVSDNGVGIDLYKFREKLFMLYQRLSLDVEGKGMGLYMVKTQVQALNGYVDIESSPGRGSSFTVIFDRD